MRTLGWNLAAHGWALLPDTGLTNPSLTVKRNRSKRSRVPSSAGAYAAHETWPSALETCAIGALVPPCALGSRHVHVRAMRRAANLREVRTGIVVGIQVPSSEFRVPSPEYRVRT